jgi:hypothetical protein
MAMWKARDPRIIIEAAERAATSGNYVSAANLLRDAARLQEARLGPLHPDLANTLNNLGVVCERIGKPYDAEESFRRARAIAAASLPPDHPFVITSRKNLVDFCEARGKRVEPEPARKVRIESKPQDPELTSKKLFNRIMFGALGPIAMLMVVLAAGLPRLSAPEQVAPLPAVASKSPLDVAPPPAAAPVEPIAEPVEATTVSPQETVTTTDTPKEAGTSDTMPQTPAQLVVVRASLCADLDDWLCDPADRPVPPGPLFFYTQVKSTTATTIQHRWFHHDRLYQAVDLQVHANRSAGYRTFSRNHMKSDSAGDWRVELRGADGALLHEERFTVR